MNFYLFVDPQYKDYSDSHIWQNNLYALAVWESSEKLARQLVQQINSQYNNLNVRYIPEPTKLSNTKNEDWDN